MGFAREIGRARLREWVEWQQKPPCGNWEFLPHRGIEGKRILCSFSFNYRHDYLPVNATLDPHALNITGALGRIQTLTGKGTKM